MAPFAVRIPQVRNAQREAALCKERNDMRTRLMLRAPVALWQPMIDWLIVDEA